MLPFCQLFFLTTIAEVFAADAMDVASLAYPLRPWREQETTTNLRMKCVTNPASLGTGNRQ